MNGDAQRDERFIGIECQAMLCAWQAVCHGSILLLRPMSRWLQTNTIVLRAGRAGNNRDGLVCFFL